MPDKNFCVRFKKLVSILFILALSPVSLIARDSNWTLAAGNQLRFLLSLTSPAPRLLTQGNTTRGLALEATTFRAEPFSLTQIIHSGTDARTRLLLFATDIDPIVGPNPFALSADAEDGSNRIFPMVVEYVHRLPTSESVYAIHIRLNDDMSATGDVLVRLYYNGIASNRVRVGLGHVGDGPPDDVDPEPTPSPSPGGAPVITELSPSSVSAGATGVTLVVSGSNFTANSTVQFNGSAASTTYVNQSLLFAALLPADLATAGTQVVRIQTPGQGMSNPAMLTVNNPPPVISNLSPASAIKGASGFTLNISGSGFVQGSAVKFNGNNRATTFVSAALLSVQILASDLSVAGSFPVSVTNPSPSGGTSNSASFTVAEPTQHVISYPAAVANLLPSPAKTAYYRFSETSGTSVADSSGGGHPATISGGVTLNQPSLLTGDSNSSALFGGGNVVSTNFMPALTSLTMSVLFKPSALPTGSTRVTLVSVGLNDVTGLQILDYTDDPTMFRYNFYDTSGVARGFTFPIMKGLQTDGHLFLNRTYHVTVTHDFVAKTVKLYLDGLLVSTQTHTQSVRTSNSQPVRIGMDNVRGHIDEPLALGDRVLTDAEVRSLMRASVGADQTATAFYVSPSGNYRASGSIGDPIDLYTAFRSGLAAPGQTYWLRGGSYHAPAITNGDPTEGYWLYTQGTAGNPIRYREYPNERVILDGDRMALGATLYGDTGTAVVQILGTLVQYVELWDVEITNSNSDALANRAHARPQAILVQRPNIKLIGIWSYDTGQGAFIGDGATDFEAHGCLFFNNGEYFTSSPNNVAMEAECQCRKAGHAMYLEGSDVTHRKLIKNSVAWGNANYGIHAFGTGAQASGMDVDGVVSFMNGVWTTSISPGATPAFAFAALKPMRYNGITNSVAYTKTGVMGTNYGVGKGGDPHEYFTFTNNKSFGSGNIEFIDLAHVTFSGNLIIDARPGANHTVTYIRPQDYSSCSGCVGTQYSPDHAYSYGGLKGSWAGTGNTYAGAGYTSSTKIWNEDGTSEYNLAPWQSLTNIDAGATIRNLTTSPYTAPLIYYFPNSYEPGQGFIAVYNPPQNASASVNLSSFGLVNGQAYEIRDVMNPFVTLQSGTYNTASPMISVSMSGTTVRQPLGYAVAGIASSRTSKEFKTFIVIGH